MSDPAAPIAVTVLGSGGPISNPARASSGYLVALDGVARILVDAGGGTYERLGRAGADLARLDLVLLTHTHIDHSGGLAPVVFDLFMRERGRSLALNGPAGRDMHPGARRFADLLFGRDGAWSYLHTFDGFGIVAHESPSAADGAAPVDVPLGESGLPAELRVRSVAVPHGMMPSLAYRIDYRGRSAVFSGDVSAAAPALIALAHGADLLVHDFALPERDVPHGNLHAKPSAVGRVAHDAGVRTLLATHFMPPIEAELDAAVQAARRAYAGELVLAHDLLTVALDA